MVSALEASRLDASLTVPRDNGARTSVPKGSGMKDLRESNRLILSACVVAALLFLVSRDAIADSLTLLRAVGHGSHVGAAADVSTLHQPTGPLPILGHPDAV